MKPLRMRSWFLLTGILLAGGVAGGPADAKVVLSFTGTVNDLGGFGGSPPEGISAGSSVTGQITYTPSAATEVETGPSERTYIFPIGGTHQFTVTIESHTWTTDLQGVSTCNEACAGDYLDFAGFTNSTANFPGNLDMGILAIEFSDDDAPYTLLAGHDLPDAPEDIDFGAATFFSGSVGSNSDQGFWFIAFDLDAPTVPVKSSTWGEVKALFARP
ncbi:MAG TPA: hypothetical protein VFD07_10390 [Candidatus Krumholzibacteria bacterium]|nr:hypothetical protein [Candidatus Krumholzibacteria bacterium]